MTINPKQYQLPDESTTTDVDLFAATWEAEYKPLEEALGLRCRGFDPGIHFEDAENNRYAPFVLPLWLVRRIQTLIQKAK